MELTHHVKARTGFQRVQIPMSHDQGFWELLDLIGTLGVGASTRGWFLLCRLQIHRGLSRTFRLVGGLLRGTAAHGVEHSSGTQVLEILARREEDVYIGDVVRGELLDVFRPLTTQRDSKGPQFSKLHLVAIEQLLHETFARVRHHAFDRTPGEYPVVVCDVLNELGERHHLVHLRLGVSLFRHFRLDGISHHVNTVIDHTINSFKELNMNDFRQPLSLADNANIVPWMRRMQIG